MQRVDIEASLRRLQSNFGGEYGAHPIYEDERPIGSFSSDPNRVYLTFRGSIDSLWEILTCFDIRKASMEELGLQGRVHNGIFVAFSKIRQVVLDYLHQLEPGKEIVVEGYSRGAAIATVLGVYLKKCMPERSITVLAYSPMKVFDGDQEQTTLPQIYNFLCEEDWIPIWAPSCLGFSRIGREYTFSATDLPRYGERVRNRTFLHMMSGWIADIIQCFLPASLWEAHMPETYQEGAPLLVNESFG